LRLKRLDHFGVDVADLGRAERFYREVLGMSVQMRLADQVVMRGGETSCALFLRPLGKSHHDCLYFLDPDGNLLELVGYRPKGERT
jgi:catechol 2,3-dioxygenase-like lactoylglutathione lyase family enzyme